ncbi:phage terminase large subunit [Planomicrobium okeanokoites]|uniref:Phage terminase large subunit n=1 Tax=Planomicrobium okeanokoites TaxID=244 RepID=A0ABV7KT84_PLAOK|nr:phage terminase large subunit [Planomicrobium okeanokoites]TAA71603.1 terminase [Planomicrobium okeanokoites]
MTTARELLEEKLRRRNQQRIEASRETFWEYCVTRAPSFYKDDRPHLKTIAETLQDLYEGTLPKSNGEPYENLIMNIPPRHGKSRTLILFCEWVLGKDKENKIITASYNEDLATTFSRYTRDGISEEKLYPHEIVFSDIFPDVKIKHGDGSYRQWALEGQFFNYKGAGLGGSITGKGGNILIVDDPIKNAEEAFNDAALDKQWQWFTDTFLSRQEQSERSIKVVNMTRWSKNDICGKLLASEEADEWFVLLIPAEDENGNMLCPPLLNKKNFNSLKRLMDPAILEANYFQQPVDIKGRLYKSYRYYDSLPQFERIYSYTDTADEGSDYLCSIVAGVYQGEAYLLDVYYTKDGMETTEKETASFFVRNKVNTAIIEANTGGRGFARNVERLIWENHNTRSVSIKPFHQSKNKMARILTASSFVQEHIYFPRDWKKRWPEFERDISGFNKEGKNKNDDAPDALTGIAEYVDFNGNSSSSKKLNALKSMGF